MLRTSCASLGDFARPTLSGVCFTSCSLRDGFGLGIFRCELSLSQSFALCSEDSFLLGGNYLWLWRGRWLLDTFLNRIGRRT